MTSILQLKISLLGVKPAVWRRVLVADDITLARLHVVLQRAMGWTDSHLHMFEIGGRSFGVPSPDDGQPVESEKYVKLADLAQPGDVLRYEYDFGDGWEHQVLVEASLPFEPHARYPLCVDGERACPPEDCGGPLGYADLLEAMRSRRHPRHAELVAWVGRNFDSEHLDLSVVNAVLVPPPKKRRRAA